MERTAEATVSSGFSRSQALDVRVATALFLLGLIYVSGDGGPGSNGLVC